MDISIMIERKLLALGWSAKIQFWLRSFLRRSIAVLQDIDPMMQVILICLIMSVEEGVFSFDKHTMLAIGMVGIVIFEELM